MRGKIHIKRDTLYEEVWNEPISKLALKYGLSGNGLKKICTKLHIPVPSRGYWTKIQHGYKVKKTPLPKRKKDAHEAYTLHISEAQTATKKENLSLEAMQLIEVIDDSCSKIIVPQKLATPYPLTRQLRDRLNVQKPDESCYNHGGGNFSVPVYRQAPCLGHYAY